MGQIYLVRHGQTSFGARDYDQLSELGIEQSRLLGGWLASCGLRFDRVVTGDLRRHRQTAEACCEALAVPLQADWATEAGFNEYDHEEVLRRSRPEFAEPGALRRHVAASTQPQQAFQQVFSEAMQRWMGGEHDDEYHESWPAFRARCHAAMKQLAAQTDPALNVIVFTSGGPIATICQQLLAIPDGQVAALTWTLVNSSATKLLHRGGRVTLSTLNSHAHLEQRGRSQAITYR